MGKYITVSVSGIITQVAKEPSIKGYTEGVLECFLPNENQMSHDQQDKWVEENNNRMKAICKLLNDNL